MSELAPLFAQARRAVSPALATALFGRGAYLFREVLGVLPVRAHGDLFEVLPAARARTRDFRPVFAVRAGDPPAFAAGYPASVTFNLHGCPTAEGWRSIFAWRALAGAEIVDLIACDWRLAKPPRRLVGAAPTLGFGAGGEDTMPGDEPVRLCRSVGAWVACLFRHTAALPLGSPLEQQATLRSFGAGVVCEDLEHGEAVNRLLRRDLPAPPPVLVEAA